MHNGLLLGGAVTAAVVVAALVISIIALVSPPDTLDDRVLPSSPLDVTKAAPAEYTVAVVDRAIRYYKATAGRERSSITIPREARTGLGMSSSSMRMNNS